MINKRKMKNKITFITTALFLTANFALSFKSFAQAGSLDLTFDTDGIVTTLNIGMGASVRSVAMQNDGKIVVAGYTLTSSSNDFALARYNSDGSLDLSFDTDGIVTTDFGGNNDRGYAVTIQNDGKILVAGQTYISSIYDIAIARYNSDGSLDLSFDTDGKVTTDFGNSEESINAVAIQNDGKIVVAGYSKIGSSEDFALVRYNTNGSLDSSFDTDGIVTTTISVSGEVANSVAIQSDGKIVVAGYSITNFNADFALMRYNTNGSLDTGFDVDGMVFTAIGTNNERGNSVAIQTDGKILVGGYSYIGSNNDFALVRYNSNGSLDPSFDADGKVTTPIGTSQDAGNSMALQNDGKIVVAGHTINGSKTDFALIRYNTNGSLDISFDTDGKVTTTIGASTDRANAVAIQSDGKIVACGSSNSSFQDNFVLVRYNNDVSTGINNIDNQINEVKIYPNPTNDFVEIITKEIITKYEILTSTGQVVLSSKYNGHKIDMKTLKTGMYIIKISTQDNKQIVKKIIKD